MMMISHLEFEGLSSRAHLRSWEGAAAAAATAALAALAAPACCCEELLLPPPFVTVDQPPPPPPPLLELSSTSAEDAAAAATAADVDEEASLLPSPAAVDAPAPTPGAAPPPADQAELTKPEELLSDAEGFCIVFFCDGERRLRGSEKKPDNDGDDLTLGPSFSALGPVASVPPTRRGRSRDCGKLSGDKGSTKHGRFPVESAVEDSEGEGKKRAAMGLVEGLVDRNAFSISLSPLATERKTDPTYRRVLPRDQPLRRQGRKFA